MAGQVVSIGLEMVIAWMRQDVSFGLEMAKKDVYLKLEIMAWLVCTVTNIPFT